MGNREEFEKWAVKEGIDVSIFDATGKYYFVKAKGAYAGFMARQNGIDTLKAEVAQLRGNTTQ